MIFGIIGGNNKAFLLIKYCKKYKIKTLVYDKDNKCPASINSQIFIGKFNDLNKISTFCKKVDKIIVATCKFNINNLDNLFDENCIYPNKNVFNLFKTRALEKQFLSYNNFLHANGFAVNNIKDIEINKYFFKYPIVVKNNIFHRKPFTYGYLKDIDNWLDINITKSMLKDVCIVENYINNLAEICVCVLVVNNKYYIVSYNWNMYWHNIKFITNPERIVISERQRINKLIYDLMKKINYDGLYNIKLFQQGETFFINSIRPYMHESSNHSIFNYKYSQYDYLINYLCNNKIKENYKNNFFILINIIGESKINLLLNDKVFKKNKEITFYSYHNNSNKWDSKKGFITIKKKRQNKDIISYFINLLQFDINLEQVKGIEPSL